MLPDTQLRERVGLCLAVAAYRHGLCVPDRSSSATTGSPASERALSEAGALLAPRPALIVVVWEAGTGFAMMAEPALPPAPIDIRTAIEVDRALYERAQRLAQQGAREHARAVLATLREAVDEEFFDIRVQLPDEYSVLLAPRWRCRRPPRRSHARVRPYRQH